jgi:hypothetical protein
VIGGVLLIEDFSLGALRVPPLCVGALRKSDESFIVANLLIDLRTLPVARGISSVIISERLWQNPERPVCALLPSERALFKKMIILQVI